MMDWDYLGIGSLLLAAVQFFIVAKYWRRTPRESPRRRTLVMFAVFGVVWLVLGVVSLVGPAG